MRKLCVIFLMGLVLLPRVAVACATCFGAADAPQTKALNMAIFFLLGVFGVVAIGVLSFIFFLRVRGEHLTESVGERRSSDEGVGVSLVEVGDRE